MSEATDERIVATRRRWAARGLMLANIALVLDLLVRIFVLKQEPQQYLDIALIWMGTMFFTAIGMSASGVPPYGGKWSSSWLAIAILAVEVPVILALMGMVPTPAAFLADMVIAALGAFVAIVLVRGIYVLWERRTLGRGPREE